MGKTKNLSLYHGDITKADLIRTRWNNGQVEIIVFGWSNGERLLGPVVKEYKGNETLSINLVGDVHVSNTSEFQDYWMPTSSDSTLPVYPLYVFPYYDSNNRPSEEGLYISTSKKALKKVIKDKGWT